MNSKSIEGLNENEKLFYEKKYNPFFKDNIIYLKKYHAKINDPDGYINLRKEKSTQSEVIQIINSGESIEVLDNSDEWFEVKTKDGNIGFVHKSRVKTE
uniref:SH3 domain-containing protein n=1 Tax=Ornithobacterium rhinotracheale TaxID=28251 RepID=UPI0039A6D05A